MTGCPSIKSASEQTTIKLTTADNKTSPLPQYNYTKSLLVKGLQRSYIVHLPISYNSSRQWPLVIVLHGGGSEAWTMNLLTDFNALSDIEGFVIVYPEGYENGWNDGRGAPGIKSQAESIDDVAFVSSLIDNLILDLNVDKKMVYATGISNGGIMSNRLGCELSDKIAAIASVAGNIPQETVSKLSPSRAVSVLIISGTEDPVVPFNGGDVSPMSLKLGKVISVADMVKFWISKDGCPVTPKMEQLPHLNTNDSTSTVIESYRGCWNGAEVALYKVIGGGHTWPGGLQYMPEKVVGRTSRDFSATKDIWQFFKLHPMQ